MFQTRPHGKNSIWIIYGGTRKITVCYSIFYVVAAKITVHTVKCTGTHRNFSSATMNYPSAIFLSWSVEPIRWELGKMRRNRVDLDIKNVSCNPSDVEVLKQGPTL